MQPVISAGLLMYKIRQGVPQVLLGHPGGPYYVNRDEGFGHPGQAESGESLLETQRRASLRENRAGVPGVRSAIAGAGHDREKTHLYLVFCR